MIIQNNNPGNFKSSNGKLQNQHRLETSISLWCEDGTRKSTFVNYLIECLSTAEQEPTCNRPSDELYQNLQKSKRVEML